MVTESSGQRLLQMADPPLEAQLKKLTSAISTMIALQMLTLVIVVGGAWYLADVLERNAAVVAASNARQSLPTNVENWQVYEREYNAAQGNANAQIVVIEFSDFQCPFCGQFTEETRAAILDQYGDRIRMVFKHFPLEQLHPEAMNAAIAAQCAARQGRFWEIHERLFDQPDRLDIASLLQIGESLNLGSDYADCLLEGETRAEVEQDVKDALDIGLLGTPTFLVNGKVLVGARSSEDFSAAFEEAGLRR